MLMGWLTGVIFKALKKANVANAIASFVVGTAVSIPVAKLVNRTKTA